MNAVVKASIGLVVAVIVISVGFTILGFHKEPMMGLLFIPVAILLNIVAVYWGLSRTASDSTYGKQLMNGMVIGAIAGILIFVSSFAMTSFLFPNYMDEMRAGYSEMIEKSAASDETKTAQLAQIEAANPVGQAMPGLVGTFFTSLISGAVIGLFKRKK